jgi:uncharacterized protein YjbJ (UPF0337 family)
VKEAHRARQVARYSSDIWVLSQLQKDMFMNKDQVKGAVKNAAGKLQQKTGEAIGNTDQQAKGLVKQVEGTVQKAYGDVKAALKNPKGT